MAAQRARPHQQRPLRARRVRREPDSARVAHDVRVRDYRRGHAAALLRLSDRAHRSDLLLAARCVLPRGDVRRSAGSGPVERALGSPSVSQCRMLRCVGFSCGRVHRRRCGGLQGTELSFCWT
jgi:hypothetical protein